MRDAVAIYDYLDANGVNPIEEFMRASIEVKESAKLLAKIQALRSSGYSILGGTMLTDTRERHIKEIRVNGNVRCAYAHVPRPRRRKQGSHTAVRRI